jgi:hypothetical protein
MAVSKTLLSPRPFSATGRQRAHPEPMDAEGVSFGARFALAGSVVALAWKMPAALSTNGALRRNGH